MPFEITKPLDQLKNEAAINVDTLAGQTRLKYITATPGQESTYTAKLADAKAYIADGYPQDASPYVWVDAEAIATGFTPAQIADLIIATSNQWMMVGAHIEGARLAAKQQISGADSAVAIRAAEQAFKQVVDAL